MLFFLLAACRAVIEMLGLCLIGQGVLYILAGPARQQNPVYGLFALLTRGPRRLVRILVGERPGNVTVGILCFVIMFVLWIGIALLRKFL